MKGPHPAPPRPSDPLPRIEGTKDAKDAAVFLVVVVTRSITCHSDKAA